MAAKAPTLTNLQVGNMIGLSHSGVSRIRHGIRLPSDTVMDSVESAFGWSVADQMKAKKRVRDGKEMAYAEAFERRIKAYAKEHAASAA